VSVHIEIIPTRLIMAVASAQLHSAIADCSYSSIIPPSATEELIHA
jgi:hypothetical protein